MVARGEAGRRLQGKAPGPLTLPPKKAEEAGRVGNACHRSVILVVAFAAPSRTQYGLNLQSHQMGAAAEEIQWPGLYWEKTIVDAQSRL
ncbi:uncharacterized protein VTP21DRAFT_6872 [Calcarisporiella thermophila]|uniref:uncharacterized protein n=1 Tax=Calcarisporiella thermophila TaxID=911321 RepID=UPI0037441305